MVYAFVLHGGPGCEPQRKKQCIGWVGSEMVSETDTKMCLFVSASACSNLFYQLQWLALQDRYPMFCCVRSGPSPRETQAAPADSRCGKKCLSFALIIPSIFMGVRALFFFSSNDPIPCLLRRPLRMMLFLFATFMCFHTLLTDKQWELFFINSTKNYCFLTLIWTKLFKCCIHITKRTYKHNTYTHQLE